MDNRITFSHSDQSSCLYAISTSTNLPHDQLAQHIDVGRRKSFASQQHGKTSPPLSQFWKDEVGMVGQDAELRDRLVLQKSAISGDTRSRLAESSKHR